MRVKPKTKDAIVRDPATGRAIPAEGIEVSDDDVFWRRRLDRGDVEEVKGGAPGKSGIPDPAHAPVAPLTTREGGERKGGDR
jgi:hypothetical protein